MANWIKAIYFVVILAWVIYVLSDDAVKYKSFPRRFGLSVALTVIIGLAGFALWHAAVPTSIKLLSEDSEVAESHSLASLKTGSHLDGKAALSFGYLTEQDEYVVMMRQDDGGETHPLQHGRYRGARGNRGGYNRLNARGEDVRP